MTEVLETMNEVLLEVETIANSLDMMMEEAFTQYMANILTEVVLSMITTALTTPTLEHGFTYEFEEGLNIVFNSLEKSLKG